MLNELERVRHRKAYAGPFPGPLEREFRDWQAKRYRQARIALFVLAAAGFGLSPLYDSSLLLPSPAFEPLLRVIQLLLVPSLALAAAAATAWPRTPRPLLHALQLTAVAVFWGGTLALRWFALHGEISYPPEITGVVILAVALFGGYSPRRVLVGALLFFTAAIAQEATMVEGVQTSVGLRCFSLFYMFLIAVVSSYLHELLSRIAWINRRLAEALARTDPLSGLSNRAEFNRGYLRVLAMARRERQPLGIAFVDIDNFKKINDTHGHLFGDEVIREVGQALSAHYALRPFDLKARFGGEEFVLIWYQVGPEKFSELVDNLLADIRDLEMPGAGAEVVRITASAGALWLVPDSTLSAESILNTADQLLYQAKAAGRDCAKLELRHAAGHLLSDARIA